MIREFFADGVHAAKFPLSAWAAQGHSLAAMAAKALMRFFTVFVFPLK